MSDSLIVREHEEEESNSVVESPSGRFRQLREKFRRSEEVSSLIFNQISTRLINATAGPHSIVQGESTRSEAVEALNSKETAPVRDTAEIERSNLVNICKLVVKEILEQSLRYGRMLDSDHLPLQHFFIVIEHILGHGLRPKKGLLGPRKELWDLLQSIENYCPEAQDITASVRDLPTVRTHIGRARAWLRIALMQKKLSDYLQALIENRDEALYDYYEPHALMMSEAIVVVMGILVGLNVIDCNLCVKEEDLDSQQGVIDFSLYLRSSSRSIDLVDERNQQLPPLISDQGNMIAVLDQKNYIEELNRHLNATVGNLQAKVESLTTTNALMKEDLAIARNSLFALQAENQAMRQNTECTCEKGLLQSTEQRAILERLSAELFDERKKNAELSKELKIQISLKAESDMAMKLLEKDIHLKQETIISLRKQLDDIKQINLEMYRKLQENEATKYLLEKLECQRNDPSSAILTLEKTLKSVDDNNDDEDEEALRSTPTAEVLTIELLEYRERATRAEGKALQEKEERISAEAEILKLRDIIENLETRVNNLSEENRQSTQLKDDYNKLKIDWEEAQTTLEELGAQLSVSKLHLAQYEEEIQKNNEATAGRDSSVPELSGSLGIWAPDSIAKLCTSCKREFNLTRRKHHCRSCGEIFCKMCSNQTLVLPPNRGQPRQLIRVCDTCYQNAESNK